MHLIRWLTPLHTFIIKWRGTRSSCTLLKATKTLLKLSWTKTGQNVWTAPTALNSCDYPISLTLRDHGGFVMCTAGAELHMDREWVGRELALRLLEANTHFPYGAFRLHDRGDGMREIVYSHLIDASRYTANATALIALKLLGQLQMMLLELYACDLIEANPNKPIDEPKPAMTPTRTKHKG